MLTEWSGLVIDWVGWGMGDEVGGTTLGRALYIIRRVMIFSFIEQMFIVVKQESDFQLLIETLKTR